MVYTPRLLFGKIQGGSFPTSDTKDTVCGVLTWGNGLAVGSRGGERGHSTAPETDGMACSKGIFARNAGDSGYLKPKREPSTCENPGRLWIKEQL